MKNISITLNSVNTPILSQSLPSIVSTAPPQYNKISNFNFSAQFDNEAESLVFTLYILDKISDFQSNANKQIINGED